MWDFGIFVRVTSSTRFCQIFFDIFCTFSDFFSYIFSCMKETINKDLKLKTRVWRLFEVLPLDADDYDYDFDWGFEGRSRPKKKKPKTAVELDKLGFHTPFKYATLKHLLQQM